MRSVMQHQFSQVPKADIPRSTFNRSHGHKTTFDAGALIPILVDEALPGDTFNVNMAAFARIATPIFPIMDNLYMDTQFFSVPIRLVWDNWQRFNGEQDTPNASTDFLVPQINSGAGFNEGSIYDYMGVPTKVPDLNISALFLRAYNLVYNEWYRDQNLCVPAPINKDDGPDPAADYGLKLRGKRHDYFTSALPWPQKGPGVTIPLGTVAPVVSTGQGVRVSPDGTQQNDLVFPTSPGRQIEYTGTQVSGPLTLRFGNQTGLEADLTTATAATINSLRQAFQIQKIYERDARGGTRYTEIIKAHFGVTSPDARLQRPEVLAVASTPINITPVPQTSATGTYADAPQGNLAAYGTASLNNHGFTASFTEHCIILGIVSVRADLTYQYGLNRMWSRRTRFDFYWPALAMIGEQAVLQKELFAKGIPADDDKVFGYQERYAEYRYYPSKITGLFRSNATTSLDAWHLSQEFANPPVLDQGFIVELPPIDRVIAVPSEPHFLFDSYFDMKCTRPMPVYGVPGLIDHF